MGSILLPFGPLVLGLAIRPKGFTQATWLVADSALGGGNSQIFGVLLEPSIAIAIICGCFGLLKADRDVDIL